MINEFKNYTLLAIGCSGKSTQKSVCEHGIVDDMIPRDFSDLACVKNDVSKIAMEYKSKGIKKVIECYNPKKQQLLQVIKKIIKDFNKQRHHDGIVICFSGHGGEPYGDLHLSDGELSANELLTVINGANRHIGVDLVLDSCHSGAFVLFGLCCAKEFKKIRIGEWKAACLPFEKAFEYLGLGNGVFTYHNLQRKFKERTEEELARAVDKQDKSIVVEMLYKIGVPNPVTLLSGGKQHSMRVIQGDIMEVDGHGGVILPSEYTYQQLLDIVDRCRNRYDGIVERNA